MGKKPKKSLFDLLGDQDLSVIKKDDMNKIIGGTNSGRNTWSSCGGILPQ